MFLRRIFKRPPPSRPVEEKFSLDSLLERVIKLRAEKIENFRGQLNTVLEEISRGRDALLYNLRELASFEPGEDIHPSLLKSATEARKLLIDKISRAVSGLGAPSDFSNEALSTFNERLSKSVNLTTDAMTAHGRYVKAVFEQKAAALEYRIRNLQQLLMQARTSVQESVKEISSLDSIISTINWLVEAEKEVNGIHDNIRSLESRVKEIEVILKEEEDKLGKIKSSDDFKLAQDSLKNLARIENDINRLRGTAVSRISDMSRPFRKLEKLVQSGGCSLEKEKVEALKTCINDPVAIISSDENIERLESLLRETAELLRSGDIYLDERDRRKKIDIAKRLSGELRDIKRNLDYLKGQLAEQRRLSESPILMRASGIERAINDHKLELSQVRSTIDELGKRSKRIVEEMASKREDLKKSASNVLGVKVELI